MAKGKPVRLSEYEHVFVEVRKDMPRRELHAEFQLAFDRPEVTLGVLKALYNRNGWKTGRTGRFEKGQEPSNKGKPMSPEVRAKTEATQFKKGHRAGRAEALHKPIGAERVSKDGYIQRKVHNGLPMQSRWRAVQLIRWEEINGPLPKGHALKCLDGDRTNTDPSNWEPVPRALLPRLNGRFGRGHDEAPAEIKPTLLAIARLEHKARTAKRGRKEGEDA